MEVLKCRGCEKELSPDMDIEFSEFLNDFFCSPDCAQDFYFDYMGSCLFCPDDHNDVIVKNGKLFMVEE
ncbi:hypothetical protein B7C51_24960 (plasmid) [Paenibacillus larvae subsp. pulvifaciens]|uniref:Uncharacterized protein n=1 Tax=Paenibacillus larvae subsp. pulvifaciens TaxID=1477 RepID=A0A1V0UZZ7_9BACL|nr:hypothetical protein [Paenibacillus larvae]ARF70726.1 hypothetical protein B7C51_24960 [Paenibacillus larvae subsp. pulvifaciens]